MYIINIFSKNISKAQIISCATAAFGILDDENIIRGCKYLFTETTFISKPSA